MKIAPELQCWVAFWIKNKELKNVRSEVRALLAVARAAIRMRDCKGDSLSQEWHDRQRE